MKLIQVVKGEGQMFPYVVYVDGDYVDAWKLAELAVAMVSRCSKLGAVVEYRELDVAGVWPKRITELGIECKPPEVADADRVKELQQTIRDLDTTADNQRDTLKFQSGRIADLEGTVKRLEAKIGEQKAVLDVRYKRLQERSKRIYQLLQLLEAKEIEIKALQAASELDNAAINSLKERDHLQEQESERLRQELELCRAGSPESNALSEPQAKLSAIKSLVRLMEYVDSKRT